jgi:hypothetical protein
MVRKESRDPLLQGLREDDLRFSALYRARRSVGGIQLCAGIAGDNEASREMKTPDLERPGV